MNPRRDIERSRRLPELDGVRGIAMLSVLVWHYVVGQAQTTVGSPAAYLVRSLSMTWAGVDLFFVLSGFLIGGILMDNRGSTNYYTTFYFRRGLRILPLYFLMLALFFVGVTVFSNTQNEGLAWLFENPLPAWSYITFLQNFSMASAGEMGPHWIAISWSLAVEEQFYLILPILIRLVPPAKLITALILLVVSAPIIRTLLFLYHGNGDVAGYVLLPARWDALFLGVVGAWIIRQKKVAEIVAEKKTWLIVAMIGSGILTLLMLLSGQNMGSAGMSYFGYTAIAVFSMAFILYVLLSPKSVVSSILRDPLIVWIGTISYGIYLFHEPVSGILHSVFHGGPPRIASFSDALVTLLALFVTLVLAGMSSRWLERPFIRYGERFRYDG